MTWYFYLQAKDEAGNESAVSKVSYVLDNVGPTVTLTGIPSTVVGAVWITLTFDEAIKSGQVVRTTNIGYTGSRIYRSDIGGSGLSWRVQITPLPNLEGDSKTFVSFQQYSPHSITDAVGNLARGAARVGFKVDTVRDTPTGFVLRDPATSPGTDTTPTFTVKKAPPGRTITLHKTRDCSEATPLGTVTTSWNSYGPSNGPRDIAITSSAVSGGPHTFRVKLMRPGITRVCSALTVVYTVSSGSSSLLAKVAQRRESTASSLGIEFSPATLPGLAVWLDAQDSSTFFEQAAKAETLYSGDMVTRWLDKSGKGNHYLQLTTYTPPVYQVTQGQGVVTFNYTSALGSAGSFPFVSGETFVVMSEAPLLREERLALEIISLPEGMVTGSGQLFDHILGGDFLAHIGELVAYEEALSDEQRAQLEGYLACKWQVPLAQGHPYAGECLENSELSGEASFKSGRGSPLPAAQYPHRPDLPGRRGDGAVGEL